MENNLKYKRMLNYLIILSLLLLIFFLTKQLLQYPFFYNIKIALFNIFFPFLISFIVVYIFHPILYWFEKNFSIKTWFSTLILLLVNAITIIVLINYLIPILGKQIIDVIIDIPEYSIKAEHLFISLQAKYAFLNNPQVLDILSRLDEIITTKISKLLLSFSINSILFVINSIWQLILIPIIIFIMMKDYPVLYNKLTNFLDKNQKSDWIQLLKNIDEKLGAYIRGQLIIVLYMFIGTFIPLFILKMPNAFLFALLIAITNLIPYIGPYIGGIPLCLYSYFISPSMLFASIIIILFMQQLDANIGQPLVYGTQLKIHPVVIMAVMLIGGAFGGIIGIIFAVPIFILVSEIILFIRLKLKNPK